MIEFGAALAAFLLSHSIPARPKIRARLVRMLGERGYIVAYSIFSLALLGWLISAALRAPYVPLWDKSLGQYYAPVVAMLPAFLLLAAGLFCPNPLSISFSGAAFDPERPGIVGITRHPVLWGFALWSFSHLVPNGDVVGLTMFGGFGLFSLLAMPIIDRRKRRTLGSDWALLASRSSTVPFAAWLAGRTSLRWRSGQLLRVVLFGVGLYLAMFWLHHWLIGQDPRLIFG